MKRFLSTFVRDNRGVAALEYALLVGLITLVIATALATTDIGASLTTIFTNLGTQMSTAAK